MGYIYKITNLINQKSYIGQTIQPVAIRWQQHINQMNGQKPSAIHKAFKEYGLNNFQFEIIEECANDILSDREKYWIEYYNSYNNGYNLTHGGEGYKKFNHSDICDEYLNNHLSCGKIAKKFKADKHTIGKILSLNNIPHQAEIYNQMDKLSKLGSQAQQKKVICIDKKTNNIIQEFNSETEAAQWILSQNISKNIGKGSIQTHISYVCKGIHKSAYGFKWQYKI